MTRRLRRQRDFEVTLQITNDAFIRPPREAQRNWLLNRALGEFVDELYHLDTAARDFVRGVDMESIVDRTQALLEDHELMEDWQIPVMRAMADAVTASQGEVLEIGFGRGVASAFIQERGVRTHTIVECNDAVVGRFRAWRRNYPDRDIRLIYGKWQDTVEQFGLYDGIFFHTYPLDEQDFLEQVSKSVTFAAHFFPTAAAHLHEGGVFTYLTNEADSLGRAHQRLLFRYFSSFSLYRVENLEVPEDSRDAFWSDTMVMIKAVK